MALLVEDGTIIVGAESYCTIAEAATYHANHGNAAWLGTDAVKEAALRKATAYLDGHYRGRWKGQKVYPLTQPLEWPRVGVSVISEQIYYDVSPSFYDSVYSGFLAITTIPQRLKDACCELALRALSVPLADDLNASVRREKVDVIETEYAPGALPGQITYQVVDQLLSDYLMLLNSCNTVRG